MSVALHGNLRDFGIGEVFQLIGQQRKTGILSVRGRSAEVELRFDEGRIVSAAPVGTHEHAALGDMLVRCGLLTPEQLGEIERERDDSLLALDRLLVERRMLEREAIDRIEDLLTRETLFELLRWTGGSFRFVSQPIRHARDPHSLLGAEQILMDGLRMVDEWRSMGDAIPSDATVLRRSGSFEELRRARASADPKSLGEEERVLLLIDGRLPVRRVIDLSRLGTFECTRILVRLRRDGLIEPTDPPRSRHPILTRPDGVRLRRIIASTFAWTALLAVVGWMHLRPNVEASARGMAIHARPVHAARIRFEARRLRNLADAYAFATGRWPETLDPLLRWASLPGDSLAPPPARYYYAKREGGVALLAPDY